MSLIVIVPPPFEPVSLADVYSHLRLDPFGDPPTHPDDDMLKRQIRTAREQVEQYTRRSIIQQTLRYVGRELPCRHMWGTARGTGIELRRPPFIGPATVSYFDASNTLQEMDGAGYYVDESGTLPQLVFNDLAIAAPYTFARNDAVRVEWVAGYPPLGDPATQADYAANVPPSIKDAILIGVQMLYDEVSPDKREKLQLMWDALLSSFRVYSFDDEPAR